MFMQCCKIYALLYSVVLLYCKHVYVQYQVSNITLLCHHMMMMNKVFVNGHVYISATLI